MPLNRYCFALDLKPDDKLIAKYEEHHKNVSPEIIESIRSAGIEVMDIYRVENRLFMIMETNETFSFDRKKKMDYNNPAVQKWEALMLTYQQALPSASADEKWMLMKQIFAL